MKVFTQTLTVADDAIDDQGHVNNVAYVRWVQDVAIAHSQAVGLGPQDYVALGTMFVVRRHAVEYLRAVYAGESLVLRTWIESAQRVHCERATEIADAQGKLVATARTTWVYLDRARQRPIRIPPEVRVAFGYEEA